MYPIEKYRYFTNGSKVVAVSTYAGKTVRGVANCDPNDEFSLEKGKELAAARCAVKVAQKRVARAARKEAEAVMAFSVASRHMDRMTTYHSDALAAQYEAETNLKEVLNNM